MHTVAASSQGAASTGSTVPPTRVGCGGCSSRGGDERAHSLGTRHYLPTYYVLRKYLFLMVDGLATRYIVECRSLHWLLKDCPRFNRFSDPEK